MAAPKSQRDNADAFDDLLGQLVDELAMTPTMVPEPEPEPEPEPAPTIPTQQEVHYAPMQEAPPPRSNMMPIAIGGGIGVAGIAVALVLLMRGPEEKPPPPVVEAKAAPTPVVAAPVPVPLQPGQQLGPNGLPLPMQPGQPVLGPNGLPLPVQPGMPVGTGLPGQPIPGQPGDPNAVAAAGTPATPGALAGGRATTSVVTLDVTEQESAQRRNDQLLREMTTILDSSTAGIAYLRGPVLVRCNWRFERMLGFEPGAAAGASLEEILSRSIGPMDGHKDGPIDGVRDALQALAQGSAFEAELPLVRADGPPRWYSLSVRRAQSQGEQTEAVAVLTDITRLKTQQAELEQLLRDRELMFSLSEVGIVYQRGARIERANQAMAALTGWASPELATLDAAELYEDTRACVDFEALISRGLREQGRFDGERLLRRRDGQLRWVQVAVRPVDADDANAGVICSFVDIDERRRARETTAPHRHRCSRLLRVRRSGASWGAAR